MKTSPGRIAGVFAHHGLDALAHRAQVHRHVRRVGDQVAVGVEERAAEVQPLLDVDRVGGVLQRSPICSAIDMNRLLNTSSITGSAVVPMAPLGQRGTRRSTRWSSASPRRQPGSTTVVALARR
jgi:hypothetical protein